MSEGTNTTGTAAIIAAAAPAATATGGLVAHIEKLFAESGDAALHGLRHLAAEVEKIAHGGVEPAAIEELVEDKLASVVNPFLAELKAAMKDRVEGLEEQVGKLIEHVHQIASALPPAPPQHSAAAGVTVAGVEVPAGAGALTETAPAQPAPGAALPVDGSAPSAP